MFTIGRVLRVLGVPDYLVPSYCPRCKWNGALHRVWSGWVHQELIINKDKY